MDNKYYAVSEDEIKDHSMLGTHGQKLCINQDVYWMTQTYRKCFPSVYVFICPTMQRDLDMAFLSSAWMKG